MQGKIATKLSDNVTFLIKRCGCMKIIKAYQVVMKKSNGTFIRSNGNPKTNVRYQKVPINYPCTNQQPPWSKQGKVFNSTNHTFPKNRIDILHNIQGQQCFK